jgi:SAM-dependent methyltransferase
MIRDQLELRDEAAAGRFYDERFRHGYMEDWSLEKLERIAGVLRELPLPPRGRALDFGCGAGMFTAVLARSLPGWTVEGTDLSEVAIETAAERLPHCTFFPLGECATRLRSYDFIFTHHVLEHVSDLDATARLLADISKPGASMLHILPCGNAGSFEHGVCLLRVDGIRTDPERLFFFDEEGHLRRLDTAGLVALWNPHGYVLGRQWYGLHGVGAIRQRTSFDLATVRSFADPNRAVNARARGRLSKLRTLMTALWLVRQPLAVVRNKRRYGVHGLRDGVLLAAGLVTYPFAKAAEAILRHFENREWALRRHNPAASEMFIHLVRQ